MLAVRSFIYRKHFNEKTSCIKSPSNGMINDINNYVTDIFYNRNNGKKTDLIKSS